MKGETGAKLRISKTSAGGLEKMREGTEFLLGIDVGSTSSDVVVLDSNAQVVASEYRRTVGRPAETLLRQLQIIKKAGLLAKVKLAAATGSAGRWLAEILNIPFVNEVAAQAEGVCKVYPDLEDASIIDMGGQDSKLIFLAREEGKMRIRDFALNSVCAAGTGSFLDQQAQRLGIDIEQEFGKLALQSKSVPRMAGRCSVFAKSDMIHLQQQATPNCDIIAGLCMALASNLKSNLGCGREFTRPIVFTGGVAANIGVKRALEDVFNLPRGGLLVPEEHFFTGAIGAPCLTKRKEQKQNDVKIDLQKLKNYIEERGSGLKKAPRREKLAKPSFPRPESIVHEQLLQQAKGKIEGYLGVDVGSISTNVAVIDNKKRVLAKEYLMTAGKPLEAVRQGLKDVSKKLNGKVKITGAATTGSGRYLTGDFIGADIVINEITAQAKGAAIVNPNVDTIFEIGGQDSKFISLENGVVVDFEMNHACAAGTGSFLEEQAQRLGIDINEEFAQLAFRSEKPIKLGERCTVFMESDLLSYQQQGATTEDLVAGLSYSIVANYLNRVVGRRRIGNHICFQGGTAFNKAVWAAFEKVTSKPVQVPDHHEVTGAIGAAAIARQVTIKSGKSKFRGFDNLVTVEYTVESFTCEHCPNHCEIKKVQLPGSEPLYYGSRCDRYNLKKKKHAEQGAKGDEAFTYRKQKLLQYAGLDIKGEHKKTQTGRVTTIGIPMALTNWQLLPAFSRFFQEMGCRVVLSGFTDKRVIREGVEAVTAQPCFPVKVAYGHVAELIEKDVDCLFLPSIVSMTAGFHDNEYNQLCPYVQSLPYQIRTAFEGQLGKTKILAPVLRLDDEKKLLSKGFLDAAKELGLPVKKAKSAIETAFDAQNAFEKDLIEKGRNIIANTRKDQKLFVLVSRPYNGCDDGVNLQLPKKLAEHDVQVIPMDMLPLDEARLGDVNLHKGTYWSYGQKILRAAEIIKRDPRLFAIYLSNFSCGPDSFLLTFFKDIMAQKPCLQLELDEHSADAGVITRIEAFLESLKQYKQKPFEKKTQPDKNLLPDSIKGRKLYVPYMGDCAYGLAASFRAYGQDAEVMPIADEKVLIQGREFTSGKECLPCAITTGDMLKVIEKHKNPEGIAFFMPGSSGPCRFGMYNCLHRMVLRYAGAPSVPVFAPNQDRSFYNHIGVSVDGDKYKLLKDLWTATVGVDLLARLILKVRPYSKEPKKAQQVYEKALQKWSNAVEQKAGIKNLTELMDGIACEFDNLEIDQSIRKPKIGIVGEIYVRNHPFANTNIIARLEELGAACDLASVAEWIYYTNFTRSKDAWRRGAYKAYLTNKIQNHVQHNIEKTLAVPLEKRFGTLAEKPIRHVIKLAQPYLHETFEGEAVLSVGKAVEYHHEGFGGVVNVMPFSCMPSTIVSSQTMRVSANCGNMPILNLSFDGQEDPALTTRLEALVEQIRNRQVGTMTAAQAFA